MRVSLGTRIEWLEFGSKRKGSNPVYCFNIFFSQSLVGLIHIGITELLRNSRQFSGLRMGRHSCCVKQKLRKGLWSPEEDEKLFNHIIRFGVGCWSSVPKQAGMH